MLQRHGATFAGLGAFAATSLAILLNAATRGAWPFA